MAVEMLSYIDRKSPVHHLSGVTKLVIFLMWSAASMLTYDTRVLFFLFLLSIIFFKISRVKLNEVKFVLIFILVFLVLNNIGIYLFSPQEGVRIYGTKHILFDIAGRYNVTLEQIFYQFNITLKYFVVIPAALLFMVTTHPSELASSLNKIGVNYKIAYAVSLALRYIPDIQRNFRTISHSQQARGIDLSKDENFFKRVKNVSAAIMPLVHSSLERIEVISNAMELRGFGKNKKRTWYSAKPFGKRDFLIVLIGLIILAASVIITFHDGSRYYNPFINR
ncbi:energy-coupling factor transporter transmembrane component T family protein [Metabacillus fastidiosus]|uniref:energy-coupling factor transporter transmembrane component T family protein n=1 Tax=Metabacillus fastidiosus TaxID=1458 RepID=UPI003D2A29DF